MDAMRPSVGGGGKNSDEAREQMLEGIRAAQERYKVDDQIENPEKILEDYLYSKGKKCDLYKVRSALVAISHKLNDENRKIFLEARRQYKRDRAKGGSSDDLDPQSRFGSIIN